MRKRPNNKRSFASKDDCTSALHSLPLCLLLLLGWGRRHPISFLAPPPSAFRPLYAYTAKAIMAGGRVLLS